MGKNKSHVKAPAKVKQHRPANSLQRWTFALLSSDPLVMKRQTKSRRKRRRKPV